MFSKSISIGLLRSLYRLLCFFKITDYGFAKNSGKPPVFYLGERQEAKSGKSFQLCTCRHLVRLYGIAIKSGGYPIFQRKVRLV